MWGSNLISIYRCKVLWTATNRKKSAMVHFSVQICLHCVPHYKLIWFVLNRWDFDWDPAATSLYAQELWWSSGAVSTSCCCVPCWKFDSALLAKLGQTWSSGTGRDNSSFTGCISFHHRQSLRFNEPEYCLFFLVSSDLLFIKKPCITGTKSSFGRSDPHGRIY